ncbi:MAG: hypothetical protein QXV95_07515 [Sulfolobales archaeon]
MRISSTSSDSHVLGKQALARVHHATVSVSISVDRLVLIETLVNTLCGYMWRYLDEESRVA